MTELNNLTSLFNVFNVFSMKLYRLYLLRCHIYAIFKNFDRHATKATIYPWLIDSVNNKPTLPKFTSEVMIVCLNSSQEIFLVMENKPILNFCNPKNYYPKQGNKEPVTKEDSVMDSLSTKESSPILLTMEYQCNCLYKVDIIFQWNSIRELLTP